MRDALEPAPRSRSRLVALTVALAFVAVGGQLVRLASQAEDASTIRVSMMSSPAKTLARPDIVDRNGRLLATDVQMPSLYADPLLIRDADDAAERLAKLFPHLDARELRQSLADKSRRFVWIRRGLSPVWRSGLHNLGIPGLLFVDEIRRTYPAGRLGGTSSAGSISTTGARAASSATSTRSVRRRRRSGRGSRRGRRFVCRSIWV